MNELELLAADYVLGTLDSEARELVAARRLVEPELDELISAWELRLSPWLEVVDDAAPRSDLYPLIEGRLDNVAADKTATASVIEDELAAMRDRLSRWRAAAVSGFGIAAGLLVALLLGTPIVDDGLRAGDQQFVAIFQQNDQQPAFLMNVDLQTRQVSIRPVTAEGVPGKTYQLWIKSAALGPGVRSLGLLESASEATLKTLDQYDAELLRSATFGISLEPEGGSPTGQPTGPAIHGQLYDTAI